MIILKMHFFVFIYLLIICKILEITATKFCYFNWLTDWLIYWLTDWLLSFPYKKFILLQLYMVYMTRTLYFFSVFSMKYKWFLFSFFQQNLFVFYWRMKVTNEGDIVPQVYTDWEEITNPIFLTPPLMISSILYHTLHYNKTVSALLISQLFLQSLRPRNLSFIHRVRVERSRLFSCQTISSSSSTFSHLRSSDLVSFICFGLQVNCPGFHLSAIFYMHHRLFLWITVFWLQQCLKHAVGH